jgi:hypothetical protein
MLGYECAWTSMYDYIHISHKYQSGVSTGFRAACNGAGVQIHANRSQSEDCSSRQLLGNQHPELSSKIAHHVPNNFVITHQVKVKMLSLPHTRPMTERDLSNVLGTTFPSSGTNSGLFETDNNSF